MHSDSHAVDKPGLSGRSAVPADAGASGDTPCRRRAAALPRLVAALLAPLAMTATAFPVAGADLVLSGAWVRAMPPTQRMTAAYLVVENRGDEAVTVTGARSPGADASLHATRRDGDRMRMEAVPALPVPAGGRVPFAPGGLHIMLMNMASTPKEGETVTVCLLAGEEEFCVGAEVLREAPDAADSAQHGDHHAGHHDGHQQPEDARP